MKLKSDARRSRLRLAAMILPALLGSGSAFGASEEVRIQFTGRYVPLSCNVQSGYETLTVPLPRVSVQSLSSPGDVAGSTRFKIPVECEGTVGKVRASFRPGASVDSDGRLIPQDTGQGDAAQGVRVELLNESGSVIRVGEPDSVTPVDADGSGAPVNLVYYARYYGTGGARPGVVNTYVNYVLDIP
jgi:major type 1 subunit fimbrin (pilin)